MDIFTLYVGQGELAAIRSGDEAIIVDAHMPNCDEVTVPQIEQSLQAYLARSNVRGLILTGLDKDHACPAGVESILVNHQPSWVMYPGCFKDTDAASEVFKIIAKHEARRQGTDHPLTRKSVRVDRVESRMLTGLANNFSFELFSPHLEDMDSSNNSSIVLKVTGADPTGFSYLVTGDTETKRWETINHLFGNYLQSPVMSAPHHGSLTGMHPATLLSINPHTVLISAGVDNSYGHPDPIAVKAYRRVASQVFSTNAHQDGTCFLTRRVDSGFETHAVRHPDRARAAASLQERLVGAGA